MEWKNFVDENYSFYPYEYYYRENNDKCLCLRHCLGDFLHECHAFHSEGKGI